MPPAQHTAPSPGRDERNKVTLMVLALIAGTLLLCALISTLTGVFSPSKRLLSRQGEVSVYVKPAQFDRGDVVYLVVRINSGDAKVTALRELTLKTAQGEELVSTGRIFEDPPWSDTIWGDAAQIEEEFPVQLPADVGSGGLKAVVELEYVEARTTGKGFHNREVRVNIPVTFPPGRPLN